MPALIKRYPNRKLYDTGQKRYISLREIGDLVSGGEEVSILENDTGEDITARTLSQIIMERERKNSGSLPETLLTGLVQAGSEPATRASRALLYTLGLGSLVDAELERRIDLLVEQNELSLLEGKKLLMKLMQAGQYEVKRTSVENAIHRQLAELGVPTRQEMVSLLVQVEELNEAISSYEKSVS